MYYLLRFFIRMALRLYCRRIRVSNPQLLASKGPLILASNHPNSFFDAIVLAAAMKQPVHFLAVGEMTDKFLTHRIMNLLRIIPVYQVKDGPGTQTFNEKSFAACADVLLQNGIVLIFAEGTCENNWQLRPIKKAIARITAAALTYEGMISRLKILPVSLNYNGYQQAGGTILILFGECLQGSDLSAGTTDAEKMLHLNQLLKERISCNMLQTSSETEMIQTFISNTGNLETSHFKKMQSAVDASTDKPLFLKLKNPGLLISGDHSLSLTTILIFLLAIPAAAGWIIHAPLYYSLKFFVSKKTNHSSYFDSLLFTLLFISYPLYWIVWNLSGYFFIEYFPIEILLFCMPLLAWVCAFWKENFQRVWNHYNLSRQERNQLAVYFS